MDSEANQYIYYFSLFTETLAQELEMERKSRQQALERDVKSPLSERAGYYKNSVLFSSATQLLSDGVADFSDSHYDCQRENGTDNKKPMISVKPEFREKQHLLYLKTILELQTKCDSISEMLKIRLRALHLFRLKRSRRKLQYLSL